jgi:hypothetical protein
MRGEVRVDKGERERQTLKLKGMLERRRVMNWSAGSEDSTCCWMMRSMTSITGRR